MQELNAPNIKLSATTRLVPEGSIAGLVPLTRPPRIGELAVAEVIKLGKHTTMEIRSGVSMYLFPGDTIVGVFGNRYATDQYEGYVPDGVVAECDMLSVGGVCGNVVSQHASMSAPTRLRLLGLACDRHGTPLNTKDWALPLLPSKGKHGEVILVVGSSMNAGKTTTAGTIVRALTRAGARVAAAKVTGTAAGKDGRYLRSCGALPVLDFTDAGFPSTYLASPAELQSIHRVLLCHLRAATPDYIVIEVADGLVQRETRLLLDSAEFLASVDHVFLAAGDGLSAAHAIHLLRDWNLSPRAVSGIVTQSGLAMREVEEATGARCLSPEQMMAGDLPGLLQPGRAPWDLTLRVVAQPVARTAAAV